MPLWPVLWLRFLHQLDERLTTRKNSMWLELKSILNRLSTDPAVRAIVLTGAGDKAFSTGLDVQAATSSGPLSHIEGQDPARAATVLRRHILEFQDCISSIETCEKRMYSAMLKPRYWSAE